MKGTWVWPADPSAQKKILRKIVSEDELVPILMTLAKNSEGLSNAQIDRLLLNNSQWRTLPHLEELIALGFVGYHVQFFGHPGKYVLTELGKTIVAGLFQRTDLHT